MYFSCDRFSRNSFSKASEYFAIPRATQRMSSSKILLNQYKEANVHAKISTASQSSMTWLSIYQRPKFNATIMHIKWIRFDILNLYISHNNRIYKDCYFLERYKNPYFIIAFPSILCYALFRLYAGLSHKILWRIV